MGNAWLSILLQLICLILPQIVLATPLRVVLDPGHGGEDYGARHAGLREAHLNLEIAKKLHQLLNQDPGFVTTLTRKDDSEVPLEERLRISQRFEAQLFLSLHANASPHPDVKGAEFYIENQLVGEEEILFHAHNEIQEVKEDRQAGPVASILADLARSQRILQSYQVSHFLRRHWQKSKSKMIRQGPFYVLNHSQVPAVLVEVGYLTHAKERALLSQEDHQWEVARKIHRALKDYAKNMDKLPPAILQTGHATP